jgi:hypothetical protein
VNALASPASLRRWLRFLVVVAVVGGLLAAGAHLRWQRTQDLSFAPERSRTALEGPEGRALASVESACDGAPRRWMVIGWDGADWNLLVPLLRAGKMPHLAELVRSGTRADLATFRPTVSPAIWTTVATGVSPRRHGIRHFYDQKPPLERWLLRLRHFGRLPRELFDNTDRRAPALWELLTTHRRKVIVAGYHNTFPVTAVEGVMLSNYLVQEHVSGVMGTRGVLDSRFASSLVYPADVAPRMGKILRHVSDELPGAMDRFVHFLDDEERRAFLRSSRVLREEGDQRPYFATRAWQYDEIYQRAVLDLYPELQPDVLLLHQQGIDWASHQFLNFHSPERFAAFDASTPDWRETERLRPLYRDTLESVYRDMDRKLGDLLALRSPGTAVMILSDHGFEPHDAPREPGFHDNAPPGILVLSGPGIRSGARLDRATIYDILPTLMASLDLPVAEDLEGEVLAAAFCPDFFRVQPIRSVVAYSDGPFVPRVERPAGLEDELLRQLESLGYLN